MNLTSLSRFISLILRHKPDAAGITLEHEGGWADVDELIAGVCAAGRYIDRDILDEIVRTDEKGRYAYSDDGKKIRACQGHSFPVDMGYLPAEPPELLYHGTSSGVLGTIAKQGLRPMSRQYVHLSADLPTALKVGGRRKGETAVLLIRAGEYHRDGGVFFRADNGVWLTDHLPPQYINWQETVFRSSSCPQKES
ncbi:MAG: RNA 2'-phosphotransferase [Oscillospiraceae bacterium]|nr:RNA 2'-phosphotransferase [Oscillospiraceae bacterium]